VPRGRELGARPWAEGAKVALGRGLKEARPKVS
jgi:hypothetical protein